MLHDADISITDRFGTPKRVAQNNGKMDIVKFIDDWPILMVVIVLKELIVYHEIEALTFIELYSYYKDK